jgi:hypothetical protein
MKKEHIKELMNKEVNRKEFLTIVSYGLLAVIGLGPLIHFVSGKDPMKTIHMVKPSQGYKSKGYGV